MRRREFLGGFFSAAGGMLLPAGAFETGAPGMKFGVISDIHISSAWSQEPQVEKALRWFEAQGADAVMVPGDIAHSGRISELESFAAAWNRVFPGDRGADGRPVVKLFVTGNHDLDAWWMKGDAAKLSQTLFSYGDNRREVWERLFHEEYLPIWKKTVRGYAFVGAQWPRPQPPVEAWFREHADELRGSKPFFFVQHAHPKGTCNLGLVSYDDGMATRALSPFPNAVAISGHSHQTLTDESSVWQGAFTSINAGCLRSGDNDRWGMGYDSIYPFWHKKRKENRMRKLPGEEGRCGLLVDVFDDHLVVHRRSFVYDQPIGEDWCLALPSAPGGPFDPKRQARESVGPVFASEAKVEVVRCAVAPREIAGPALAGKPCVWLKIPHPQTPKVGSRVYDFEVVLRVSGKDVLRRLVLANGFNVPEAQANRVTHCLFGADEVPSAGEVSFAVTPRNAFGIAGRAVVAS